jgi:hypothetical protein
MSRVKTGISGLPAAGLAVKAQSVHDGIEANPVLFVDPKPSTGAVQTLIDNLVAANAAVSSNKGPKELRARNEAMLLVADAMRQWSGYVQMVSNGSASIIAASNFDVAKQGGRVGELDPPDGLRNLLTRTSSRVSLLWKGEKGTDSSHVWMSTTNDPFNWELVGTTSKSRINIDGLTPGTFYWFAVSANGAAGESSKSEPCLVMAAA